MTRWEKGTEDIDRPGVEAYERLTGSDAGLLRTVIDLTRRIGRHRVSARAAVTPRGSLDETSARVWPAMHGEPRNADWLGFADALCAEGPLVLPTFTAAPVIDRLAGELARATGTAYLARYEALARLRNGPYAEVTLHSLLSVALADDSQVGLDLLDVAAEKPTGQLFTDMCRLLVDPRRLVFEGACRALERMLASGDLDADDLREALPRLAVAHEVGSTDPRRSMLVSRLVRGLPDPVRAPFVASLTRPVVTASRPRRTPDRRSPQHAAAEAAASAIKRDLVSKEDEILVRVIFEALFDGVRSKRRIAINFLAAVPYRELVARELGAMTRHEVPEVRDAAIDVASWIGVPEGVAIAEGWAVGGDPAQCAAGLATLGLWAERIDETVLRKAIDDPSWDVAQRALFAAGMSRSPLLREWADDPGKPEHVQNAARWWLRTGGRVTR